MKQTFCFQSSLSCASQRKEPIINLSSSSLEQIRFALTAVQKGAGVTRQYSARVVGIAPHRHLWICASRNSFGNEYTRHELPRISQLDKKILYRTCWKMRKLLRQGIQRTYCLYELKISLESGVFCAANLKNFFPRKSVFPSLRLQRSCSRLCLAKKWEPCVV